MKSVSAENATRNMRNSKEIIVLKAFQGVFECEQIRGEGYEHGSDCHLIGERIIQVRNHFH